MGMDLSTIIGPYLEVTGKRESTVIKVKRLCPNHPNKEQDGKFCTHCGVEVQNVEIPKIEKLHPYHVIRKLAEDFDLWSPEGMDEYIIPNRNFIDQIRFDLDNGGAVNLYDTNIDVLKQRQVEWFKNEFQPAIDLLQTTFGLENVHVRWGIISYWS
jgi:hypothetical protein